MKYNIVLTDKNTVSANDIDFSVLEQFGNVTYYDNTPPELLNERIKDANIIICNKTVVDKSAIDAAKDLKLITLFATGYNNINVKYAAEKGVVVCNAGSYSTMAVAQQVFGYILQNATRISDYNAQVHQGSWIQAKLFSAFALPTHELYGKTLGIFGYGAIGKQVAKIADAFGMNIIVCTRTPKPEADITPVKYVDMDTLLSDSDYLTLHCPLTDATRGLFGKAEFEKMKPTAFFINTARGAVTNEQELANALNNDVIAGAAVDVLSVEPMAKDCPFMSAKNLYITPHVAWAPLETRKRVLDITVENIRAFDKGDYKNKVN